MFEFRWKRDALINNLREMSDENYQKTYWGHEDPNIYGGIFGNYDFFIEDERLHEDAKSAVGYYLYDNEVSNVEGFSKKFLHVIHSLNNQYDNAEAIGHKDWPEVVKLAQIVLNQISENESEHN